jgi:O-antigen/teichoic acid export membrane protein
LALSVKVMSSLGAGSWSALVGLLVLPTYLHYVGVESFGLLGFVLTLQAWFLLLDLGLSPTASREMARFSAGQHSGQGIRDLFVSLERVYFLIAVVIAGALVTASDWLATDWLQLGRTPAPQAAQALSWMAGMVAIQWMATLYRSAINGLQFQVWLAGLTVAAATLRAVATVATLAWISPTLEAFVLAQSACYLVEACAMRYHLQRRLPQVRGRFRLAALASVWRFAAGVTAITLLATLLYQMDKLLLARLLPLEQFGYFSLAMTVIGALSIVVTPIFNTAYPRLAELFSAQQQKSLSDEYHAFSQMAAVALFPVATTLVLFSGEAVYAWTGDRRLTAQVAPMISVWAVGAALNGVMHVPYALQLAMGWVRLSITMNVLVAAIMVPAILVLVPRFGALAAGWVWATVNLVYLTIGSLLMHRKVLGGELARWYLRDLAPALAAPVAVGVVAWTLRSGASLDRHQSGFLVAAVLLAAASAALAASAEGRKYARAALVRWPRG